MSNRYLQDNKAENIRRWLKTIDLKDADILSVERSIYAALTKIKSDHKWDPAPIAPLAEPANLNDLVGKLFIDSRDEIRYHLRRTDNFYRWLSETNNTVKADLEGVEGLLAKATDDMQEVAIIIGDAAGTFYWLSDSFNTPIFVDKQKTTALVDTDYGAVSLAPVNQFVVQDWDIKVDQSETKGLPGANMLVLDIKSVGSVDNEPEIVPETTDCRNLGNLLDTDPNTWFEVERNYVAPSQKVVRLGRAFVYSPSGNQENVKDITKDLDWKVAVNWPGETSFNAGSDGKGIPLAEFRDLSSLDKVTTLVQKSEANVSSAKGREEFDSGLVQKIKQWKTGNKATQPPEYDPDIAARLSLDITMSVPQPLSAIKLLPFVRGAEPIKVDRIQVLVDDIWLDVVIDVELGTNKSTTRLEKEILRRTGVQNTGSIYYVPTDRDVQKIKITLSALPEEAKKGLYHPFQEDQSLLKTTRKLFGISSTRTRKKWQRKPVYSTPPTIVSESSSPKLLGSLTTPLAVLAGLGSYFSAAKDSKAVSDTSSSRGEPGIDVAGSASAISAGLKAANVGGTLGGIGTFLGTNAPIIGGILALNSLVGNLFGTKKTAKLLAQKFGVDIFRGWRASIALRDLTLLRTIYASQSVMQTVKRTFPGPVSRIGLFAEEDIPTGWGPGDWVSYFISTDGENWTPIPKLSDVSIEKSYVPPTPTTDVYLLFILKGNASDIFRGPRVKHYVLQGLPA